MSENQTSFAVTFIIRGITGMALIFFMNQFLDMKEIAVQVGLNPVSFITSGIFGIPGVALLYGIAFYAGM